MSRWLYIATTPASQIYSDDDARQYANPLLPIHRADWQASPTVAQLGRRNDSFTVDISATGTLAARICAQAPYGVRVDVMDGATVSRSGVTATVEWAPDGLRLTVEADQWSRDLPIRSSAELQTFGDLAPLPWRYGRDVTGELVAMDQRRTTWLWADHASSAIRSVQIEGQEVSGWDWRNTTDVDGNPITVIRTSDPVDLGATITATGDGALSTTSGGLLTNPADVVYDICRRAGLLLSRGDFAALRAECLARNLEVSGSITGGSLQAAVEAVAQSIYAAFSRTRPGLLMLLPSAASSTASIRAADVLSAVADREAIATRLRARYAMRDGRPRRSLEVRAPSVELLRGERLAEVELSMIADDRAALDVASRMLGDMARPLYSIRCARIVGALIPSEIVSVSLPIASGDAVVQSVQYDESRSTPTLALRSGTVPAVSLYAVSAAYDPEQYAGAAVITQGDVRIITITDEDGAPVVGAQCILDGSIIRTTDNAGRVEFPASLMPPGQHVIAIPSEEINITVVVP